MKFHIGSVEKVRILLDWTLLLYFGIMVGLFGLGTGLFLGIAVMMSVLLHEAGHVIVAKKFGIQTIDITLSCLGGAPRMPLGPDTLAKHEAIIAVAGPIVSLALAGLTALPLLVLPVSMIAQAFATLCFINLAIGVFNLIPAYPMDGGRILRSLFRWKLDYLGATRLAVWLGLGVFAVFAILAALYHQWFILAIMVFMSWGSWQEKRAIEHYYERT